MRVYADRIERDCQRASQPQASWPQDWKYGPQQYGACDTRGLPYLAQYLHTSTYREPDEASTRRQGSLCKSNHISQRGKLRTFSLRCNAVGLRKSCSKTILSSAHLHVTIPTARTLSKSVGEVVISSYIQLRQTKQAWNHCQQPRCSRTFPAARLSTRSTHPSTLPRASQ